MSQPLVDKTFLIDDSDIDLFIQRRFLEVYQFSRQLILFKSAEEALDALRHPSDQHPPEVIFLDLNMPEIDGFSFLENFRSLPAAVQQRTRVVVLTSSNSAKDREQVFSFPCVIQFITKPLKQADLETLRQKFS